MVSATGRLVIARPTREALRARMQFEGIASSGARFGITIPTVRMPARRPFVELLAASDRSLVVRFSGSRVPPVVAAIRSDGRVVPIRGLPVEFDVVAATDLPNGGVALLVDHLRTARLVVVDARGGIDVRPPTRVDDGKVLAIVRRGAEVAVGVVDDASGAIAIDGAIAERIGVDWSDVPTCAAPPTDATIELVGAFPAPTRHEWERDDGSMTALSVVDGHACLRWFVESGSRGRPDEDPPRRFAPGATPVGQVIATTGIAELRIAEAEAIAVGAEPRVAFARLVRTDGRTELLIVRSDVASDRTVFSTEPIDDPNARPTIVGVLPFDTGRRGSVDFIPGRFADGSLRTPLGVELPRDGSCARPRRRRGPIPIERLAMPARAFVLDEGHLTIGDRSHGFPLDVVGTVDRVEGPRSTFVAIAGGRRESYADMRWTVPQVDLIEVDRTGAITQASVPEVGSFHLAPTLALALVDGTPYVAVADERGHAIRFFVRTRGELVRALPPLAVTAERPAVLAWSGPSGRVVLLDTPIASRRPYLRVLRHEPTGWHDVVTPLPLVLDPSVVGVPDARFVGDALVVAVPHGHEGFDVLRATTDGWETVRTHRFDDVVVRDDVCERVRAELRAEIEAEASAADEDEGP